MYSRIILLIFCLLHVSLSFAQGKWEVVTSTSTPTARWYARMVAYNQSVVIIGGTPNGTPLSDVHQCNHATGVCIALPSSTFGLIAHSAVVTKNGLVIVFAGTDGTRNNRVTTFDLNTKVWDTPTVSGVPPDARTLHTAVLYQDSMIVYGGGIGSGNPVYGDMWSYNITSRSWTELQPKGTAPNKRSGHTSVITADGTMIIYGGWNGGEGGVVMYNDIAHYQVSNNSWLSVTIHGAPPIPTYDHSAVLTSKNIMLVFGGESYGETYFEGSVARFDVSTSTWLGVDTLPNTPQGRSANSYALVNDYFVIFGGLRDNQLGDMGYYSMTAEVSTFTTVETGLLPTTSSRTDQSSDSIVDDKSSDSKGNTPVIAAVVGTIGGIFVIISGVALFCLVKKRRDLKKKGEEIPGVNLEMKPEPQATNYAVINMDAIKGQGVQDAQMSSWEVNWEELEIKNELGRGAYGVVFKATWRMQIVAVKKIIGEFTQNQVDEFMLEAELMSKLRPHANVVQFLGVSKYPLAILTNYYEGGSLKSFLKDHQSLTESEIITILQGVAAGMEHLHMEKIIHRDLAARNILIGVEHGSWKAVVSDFGFARVIQMKEQKGETKSNVGPVRWMAPESIANKEYSPKSDVWSFGVLVYEIITKGQEPWNKYDDLRTILAITAGEKIEIPKQCPEELADIMTQCWEDSPDDRPTFREIYSKLLAYQEMLDSQKKEK